MDEDFIVVTTYDIDDAEIEKHIGLVQGSTVRARNVGSDFLANLKNIVGGESLLAILNFYRLQESRLMQE